MTILDEIMAKLREDLILTKQQTPYSQVRAIAAERPPCRDFAGALRARPDGAPRIIAELKKASPSKGLIRPDFDPVAFGREYAASGAAAISVLTERHYFQGHPDFLRQVAQQVDIPVLRKDFIFDEYQICEARAWGADAVLLIAAALSPERFLALHTFAREMGLGVLSEVHNRAELEVVLTVGVEVVGINSRDLRTFKTDLAVTEALAADVPDDVVLVGESGIHGPADIQRLMRAGLSAFLIGESLMRSPSPGEKLRELIAESAIGDD